ncbi:MAG: NAD-dependent epimerase/dehydratase family protein [Candidatus Sumerlaeaceae bacterium]
MKERDLPTIVESEAQLEELLSRPHEETIAALSRCTGDLMILGVGGKVGPSLARMAVRAFAAAGKNAKVFGVSRFSDVELRRDLQLAGVHPIPCDLLNFREVEQLPKVPYVIFLAGRKFGGRGTEPLTWATNTAVPLCLAPLLAEAERLVAFSTGCVYPLVPVHSSGCSEEHSVGPVGEYAWSCLGRERIFEYLCEHWHAPTVLIRLNYAHALRYGVLTDIASDIAAGRRVSLRVPAVNIIWQGDMNNWTLRSIALAEVPARKLNVSGLRKLWVREVALSLAAQMGKDVHFADDEGKVAYLTDARRAHEIFGHPQVDEETMIRWTAHWVGHGMPLLGRPTHFQVTDGQFLD